MYNAAVIHYFAQDNHIGELDPHLLSVGTGIAGVVGRGDVIQLQINVVGGVVNCVKGLVYGTPASVASLAWLAENAPGLTLQQLLQINSQTIQTALDLPANRFSGAILAVEALRLAHNDYQTKQCRIEV